MTACWSRKQQIRVGIENVGVTFVDPNSWVDDWDFGRDGLHTNRRGARHLGQLYFGVCGISSRRQKMRSE